MFEEPDNECRFGDHGYDTHRATTARAVPQVNIEHPAHDPRDGGGRAKQEARAESLHPAHRGCGFGLAGFPCAIVFVVRRGH